MSDTVIVSQRIEGIAEGIKDLLEDNLSDYITAENNHWNDTITIDTPENDNIFIDDPNGFTLLDIGQFPCVFIFPSDSKRSDNFTEAYQLEITGFIREDDKTSIVRKNLRFCEAVKATLQSDLTCGGIVGGGIIGKVAYSQVMASPEEFFTAFQIEIAHIVTGKQIGRAHV